MRDWSHRLLFKLICRLKQFFEVKPFLLIDPCSYCPACGDTKTKKTQAVVLEKPDEAGSKIAVLLECAQCRYQFVVNSVTIIKDHIMGEPEPEDDEQAAIDILSRDKRTKGMRSQVKVNGQVIA